MKKYKVTYIADGSQMEDVWYAENEREARVCAMDTYREDYKRVRITNIELISE